MNTPMPPTADRPGRPLAGLVSSATLVATTLVAATLAVAGCGIVDTDDDRWARDLEVSRARWAAAEMTDYRYRVRQLCFCGFGGQVVEVEVRDGVTVSGVLVETGESIEQRFLEYAAPSIDDLFDRIEQILDDGPHEFEARYDPDLGFPVSVSSDPIENAVDEEWGVEASDVEPVT